MAIIKNSSKVLACVELVGKVKQGQYGDYQSVLFSRYDAEGEAGKIWKSMKPTDAARFHKGMQVFLIPARRDNKDTWDVEIVDSDTPLPSSAADNRNQGALTLQQKRDLAQYLSNRADLLAYCFQLTHEKLAALDAESQRAAAIELYRSTVCKFDL